MNIIIIVVLISLVVKSLVFANPTQAIPNTTKIVPHIKISKNYNSDDLIDTSKESTTLTTSSPINSGGYFNLIHCIDSAGIKQIKVENVYFLKENLSCYQQNAKIQYSYFDQGNEIKAIGYLTKNSRIISSSNLPSSDNCVKLKRFDLNDNREIIMVDNKVVINCHYWSLKKWSLIKLFGRNPLRIPSCAMHKYSLYIKDKLDIFI
jgi:hypothetical protein